MVYFYLKLFIRLLLLFVIGCPLLLVQIILYYLHLPGRKSNVMLLARILLGIARIKVRVHGALPQKGGLIVSNHVNWLDIILIASVLPPTFVAKSEIARWPIMGFVARITGSIFVERDSRFDSVNQSKALRQCLLAGESVVLFPEGTTGNGTIVAPFKSALFSAAEAEIKGQMVKVQAMSLVLSEVCGISMGRRMRLEYAWMSDIHLGSNIMKVLAGSPITIDLVFWPPTDLKTAGGRKNLAKVMHGQVQDGVVAFTSGHKTKAFASVIGTTTTPKVGGK